MYSFVSPQSFRFLIYLIYAMWWFWCRRIPYTIALRYKHGACAALLNPSSAEPLVWPSPLKFISELNKEAKHLLECALMEANKEREKNILKGTTYSPPSPTNSDNEMDDNISEVITVLKDDNDSLTSCYN